MSLPGNLGGTRIFLAFAGAPLLGGFAWGVLNPPAGFDSFLGRMIHGALAAPMSLFMIFIRPDRVPSWPLVGVALLFLLWVGMRLPILESEETKPSRDADS